MTTVTVRMITPAMASEFLGSCAYGKQRNVVPVWTRHLAEEMELGSFKQDTAIEFARQQDTGKLTLIDGYHRLNAVVKSGIPTRFVVIESTVLSEDAIDRLYYRIDQQKRRGYEDQLRVLGIAKEYDLNDTQVRRLAAAVTMINANWTSKTLIHFDDRERLVREYSEECGLYFAITSGRKRDMRVAFERQATLSVGLVTLKYSVAKFGQEKVEEFWEGLATNDGLGASDARRYAYDHLLTASITGCGRTTGVTYPARYSAKYVATCFNAFVSNKPINRKPNVDLGDPMLILGSPFNGK